MSVRMSAPLRVNLAARPSFMKREHMHARAHRRYEVECWFYVPERPPKWVGRSDHSDPKKFPPRSARRSVGRSRPTRFFLRRAPRGSAGRSVGRKLRPDFFSPRRVGGSVGRTRPTQNWRSPQHLSRSVDTKVFPSGHCHHPTLR